MTEYIDFTPHSEKQDEVIFSDSPITIAGTGVQWGKTKSGALWLKRLIHTHTSPDDNFIITSPTYKTVQQSTLLPFLQVMQGYGTYNKSDAVFETHWGSHIWVRTGTDPDSVVGIPRVRGIWCDESGKYSLYFWENIQGRASTMGAPILHTTSPYALNWIYKDLIKPYRDGERSDIKLVQAGTWENPYHSFHDPTALARAKSTMDPRRFNMLYGGQWSRLEGLVYDCWDDDQNLVQAYDLPAGTQYVAGIDWGYYPDPFALKIRAITPGGDHFGVSEFVKNKLTITDIAAVCRQKKQIFGIKMFYCDPSQPGYIEELNRSGVTAMGADNDIRRGLDLHYELIKSRKYKEFRGECQYSADEREVYHYPEPGDLKPDQDSKELVPVDKDNHCMDVDRYITIMTYRSKQKSTPKTPGDEKTAETQMDRLARLKRFKRSVHTESWS